MIRRRRSTTFDFEKIDDEIEYVDNEEFIVTSSILRLISSTWFFESVHTDRRVRS